MKAPFAFIGTDAEKLLALPDEGSAAADADRTAAALLADYERWSRWLLGVVAYIMFVMTSFVAVAFALTLAHPGMRFGVLDVIVEVIAVALALVAGWILVRLWHSGRRMLRPAAAWTRIPYIRGVRKRDAGGWVHSRSMNFEPRIFVRLVTASLALLVGVAGVALFVRDVGAIELFSVAALVVGLASLLCGMGQVGGVMRLVSAASEADPLWVRIRGLFRT